MPSRIVSILANGRVVIAPTPFAASLGVLSAQTKVHNTRLLTISAFKKNLVPYIYQAFTANKHNPFANVNAKTNKIIVTLEPITPELLATLGEGYPYV